MPGDAGHGGQQTGIRVGLGRLGLLVMALRRRTVQALPRLQGRQGTGLLLVGLSRLTFIQAAPAQFPHHPPLGDEQTAGQTNVHPGLLVTVVRIKLRQVLAGDEARITSYNVCYTKLLRFLASRPHYLAHFHPGFAGKCQHTLAGGGLEGNDRNNFV